MRLQERTKHTEIEILSSLLNEPGYFTVRTIKPLQNS